MSATEKRNNVDTVAWNKQINWKLPMEMLERVFQFLAPKDLKTARLVCKHLEMVDISGTAMTAQQKETLFSALENQNQVTALVLTYLDLSSVNPTLLGNVCSKIFSLELTLTAQQASSRFNELAYNNELMRESVRELKLSKTDLSQIDGSAFLLGVAKLAELDLSFSSLTPPASRSTLPRSPRKH